MAMTPGFLLGRSGGIAAGGATTKGVFASGAFGPGALLAAGAGWAAGREVLAIDLGAPCAAPLAAAALPVGEAARLRLGAAGFEGFRASAARWFEAGVRRASALWDGALWAALLRAGVRVAAGLVTFLGLETGFLLATARSCGAVKFGWAEF